MRRRVLGTVSEAAFVVGVMAGVGYAAALLTYTLVTRWMGGGL